MHHNRNYIGVVGLSLSLGQSWLYGLGLPWPSKHVINNIYIYIHVRFFVFEPMVCQTSGGSEYRITRKGFKENILAVCFL